MDFTDEDLDYITRVINSEVPASHGPEGRAAVLGVILNRINAGTFGEGVRGVLEKKNQFQPVTEAGGNVEKLPASTAKQVLQTRAMLENFQDPTGGALYFQNPAISQVKWAGTPTYTVGPEGQQHVFYKSIKELNRGRKMADVPNMLKPPSPTIGDLANPQPFYQDAPPEGQDDFTQRYQENLAFMKSPAWKALLLQTAISALQPRAPGQSGLAAAANAVASGGEAAGRELATEEELRARGVKEQQGEEALGLRRQQIAQTGEIQRGQLEVQKGQLKLQESRLSIDKATLAKMDDQSKLNWARLDFDREKLDKDYARIDAESARAEGRNRISMLQNLGRMNTDLLKNAQDRLQLLKPGTPDYDRIQGEINVYQTRLDDVMKRYRGELEKAGVMGPQAEATLGTKPEALTPDSTQWATMMSQRNYPAIKQLVRVGRIKLTADQQAELDDVTGERIVPREAANFGQRVARAADVVFHGGTFTANMERNLRTLDDPRTTEQMKKAARAQIVSAFPSLDEHGKVPKLQLSEWELIFKEPRLEKLARSRFGDKTVDTAKRQFENRQPVKDYKKQEQTKELKLFE